MRPSLPTNRRPLPSEPLSDTDSLFFSTTPGRKRHFVITKRTIATGRWPAHYPPLTIAVIADPHVGCRDVPLAVLEDIVHVTNTLSPDLTLLLGDFIAERQPLGRIIPPEPIALRLAALKARMGVVSVLGNHDWEYDGLRTRRALEGVGIPVLENSTLEVDVHAGLGRRSQRLLLGGLADQRTRHPDYAPIAQAMTPDVPLILMAHDPASHRPLPPGPALQLSGHTHGGQVRLPWFGPVVNSSKAPLSWSYGHLAVAGHDIVVSSGLGTSLLPLRWRMKAELLLITLVHAPALQVIAGD